MGGEQMLTVHEYVLQRVIYRMLFAALKFLLAVVVGLLVGAVAMFAGWCAGELLMHSLLVTGWR
jgi:hypothetical protein